MLCAVLEFVLFAIAAGAFGYVVWTKTALKSDLKDDGIIK